VAEPIPHPAIGDTGVVTEPDVAIQQRMINVGAPAGNRGGHRPITARAAAYSAATCSVDRCT
jgi:hypothetical protein